MRLLYLRNPLETLGPPQDALRALCSLHAENPTLVTCWSATPALSCACVLPAAGAWSHVLGRERPSSGRFLSRPPPRLGGCRTPVRFRAGEGPAWKLGSAARYAVYPHPGDGKPGLAGAMESAGAGQGGASCRVGIGSPGFASPAHSAALSSEPRPAPGTDIPRPVSPEPQTWRV